MRRKARVGSAVDDGAQISASIADTLSHAVMVNNSTANYLPASNSAGSYLISRAAQVLRNGGVIAHATEGVWGLACVADADEAVLRILASKRRSWRKGLILVADTASHFAGLLRDLPEETRVAIMRSWPGPVTWLVPHHQRVSRNIGGSSGRVALRVTAHAQFAELCRRVGAPLVSTSANRGGSPPVLSAGAARVLFGGEIDFVLAGELGGATGPSAIYDALTGEQMRSPVPVTR